MDYWMVMMALDGSAEPGINGGIVGRHSLAPKGGEPVISFVCTIEVASVDEYVKKIEAAGGKITLPKMAIPAMALLAYEADIEGNTFGIFEENKSPHLPAGY